MKMKSKVSKDIHLDNCEEYQKGIDTMLHNKMMKKSEGSLSSSKRSSNH